MWVPHGGSRSGWWPTISSVPPGLTAAAAAVKPGGTLLIVGHHPDRLPPWGNHTSPEMFYTPAQLVQELGLDSPEWQVEVKTTRERVAAGPDGQEAVIGDTVLRATRLA